MQQLETQNHEKDVNGRADGQPSCAGVPDCSEVSKRRPFTKHIYESSSQYILGVVNSICLHEGKIYNLLNVRRYDQINVAVKCKCVKSKCQAKYCECYTKGVICSIDCSCHGCVNKDISIYFRKGATEFQGCRCSKSRCSKNYCDCFHRGTPCTSACKCTNCHNQCT